ncbi:MAG TPA: hypothetical protein PKM17_13495 [Syntrophorhabdus sp.]|nr:hypothetical protein [Syntrophorhabdus sp.]HPA55532.1 hypothetical protein [Bacillota bacterium]HQO41718.1 hypothetical protein [Bacillota bacterium]HQQ43594.1 hypothetical protein [Bacillota bacterium]
MEDKHINCEETIVHQMVKVQAQVSVEPYIKCGRSKVYCIDSHIRPDCECDEIKEPERCDKKCTFTLTQVICVEIPIAIGVDVDVDPGIVRCGTPDFGPCKSLCECTETMDKDDESSRGMVINKIFNKLVNSLHQKQDI